MIYQLKITLQQTSPPIWRRILVHKDMMLTEVHEVIQIAFDWLDYHLHCFEPRTTNGERLYNKHLQIGIENEQLVGLLDYDYDETEEKLSNWLVKEKDRLMYVYDFGDDWRHEIVLEKILPVEEGQTYPYCIKALRASAEEDSGGFVEEAEYEDPNELKEAINEAFEHFTEEFSPVVTNQDVGVANESNWNYLLQQVVEFSELAPWKWLDDNQIFAIEHPEIDELVYCSVLGSFGEEFGLAIYIGNDGLRYLKLVLDGSIAQSDIMSTNHGILLSLCDRDEMTDVDEQFIKQGSSTFQGRKKWPIFRSFIPGYYPWFLTEDEVVSFAIILKRVIHICERAKDKLHLNKFHDTDKCFAQLIEEQNGDIILKDTYISVVTDDGSTEPRELLVNELDVQRLRSVRKRLNTTLEVGCFYAPAPVQEDPSVRPHLPTVFVAADRKTGSIIFHDIFQSENREQACQTSFLKLLEQLQAIPREIWVTNDVYLILKPILDKLKINVLRIKRPPIITELKEEMYEQFSQ